MNISPINTSTEAEELSPDPLNTFDVTLASKPFMSKPLSLKAFATPLKRDAVVFFSSSLISKSEMSIVHLGKPSLQKFTIISSRFVTAAIVSRLIEAPITRPRLWSVWLPAISVRPLAEKIIGLSFPKSALWFDVSERNLSSISSTFTFFPYKCVYFCLRVEIITLF